MEIAVLEYLTWELSKTLCTTYTESTPLEDKKWKDIHCSLLNLLKILVQVQLRFNGS